MIGRIAKDFPSPSPRNLSCMMFLHMTEPGVLIDATLVFPPTLVICALELWTRSSGGLGMQGGHAAYRLKYAWCVPSRWGRRPGTILSEEAWKCDWLMFHTIYLRMWASANKTGQGIGTGACLCPCGLGASSSIRRGCKVVQKPYVSCLLYCTSSAQAET